MEPPEQFDSASSAYLTPPASPGKRRRRLRESEETEGEMLLEAYLYRSDPYRKSSFQVPLPLPYLSEDPPSVLQLNGDRVRPLVPAVIAILKENSFERDQLFIKMALLSKPGYPNGNVKHLALVINVNQGINISTIKWTRARDEVVRLFATQGLPQVKVEMFDTERAFMPSLFPLHSQNPLVQAYEAVREKILDRLELRLGKGWRAVSVFNLGPQSTTAKPTVVIFVQPGLLRNWKTIQVDIQHILRKTPGVQIEFLPGYVSDLPDELSSEPERSFEAVLHEFPEMGTSIGEVGKPGAGTLGGFVSLECNGKVHSGVLTNHHVVRPIAASQQVVDALDQHGYGATASPPTTTIMQYPAADDLRSEIVRSAAARDFQQEQLHKLQERLERFRWKEQDPPETLTDRLNDQRRLVERAKRDQQRLKHLPITLGQVLYSSGDAISAKSSIIDWAFIELQHAATIPQKNRLPDAKNVRIFDRQSHVVYEDGEVVYARKFVKIKKDEWYYKLGRTTDLTTGICNGIEVDVQREGQIRYDETGKKAVLEHKSTRELIIVSVVAGKGFCIPGDSGSLIINQFGDVAGLMYGELNGWVGSLGGDQRSYQNAGLVTSMDEVLASIRAKTGGTLRLL